MTPVKNCWSWTGELSFFTLARGRTRKAPPPPDSTITARQKFVSKVLINEPQTAESQNVEVEFTCEKLRVDGCEGGVPACFAHLWEKHFSINLLLKE